MHGPPKQNPDGTWSAAFRVQMDIPLLDDHTARIAADLATFALVESTPDGPLSIPASQITEEFIDRLVEKMLGSNNPDAMRDQVLALVRLLVRLGSDASALAQWSLTAGAFLERLPAMLSALNGASNLKSSPA